MRFATDAKGARATPPHRGVSPRRDRLWTLFQQIVTLALLVGALFIAVRIIVVVLPRIGSSLHGSPIVPGFAAINDAILAIHIATAVPPLLLGFLAFMPASRSGGAKLHRWVGTVYCVAIWISATTGLVLAAANTHGPLAKLGFGTLAVAWFVTTLLAYRTARARQFVAHRSWMIRSFALTLAVIAIRPLHFFGPPAGIAVADWFVMLTWLCWVPNLIVGEIYSRVTTYTGRLAVRGRIGRAERRQSAATTDDTVPAAG
jgi:uncharacterized membrane protein